MSILFSVLPLLLAVLMFGVFGKLAARILRRNLAWSHALVFGFLIFVVGAVGALLNRAAGLLLPLPVAVIAALLLQTGIGGLYLAPRATTQAGEPVKFRGGVTLSLISYLLAIGFGIVLAITASLLLQGHHA